MYAVKVTQHMSLGRSSASSERDAPLENLTPNQNSRTRIGANQTKTNNLHPEMVPTSRPPFHHIRKMSPYHFGIGGCQRKRSQVKPNPAFHMQAFSSETQTARNSALSTPRVGDILTGRRIKSCGKPQGFWGTLLCAGVDVVQL